MLIFSCFFSSLLSPNYIRLYATSLCLLGVALISYTSSFFSYCFSSTNICLMVALIFNETCLEARFLFSIDRFLDFLVGDFLEEADFSLFLEGFLDGESFLDGGGVMAEDFL